MVSTESYLHTCLAQLSDLEHFTYRKMMGEYLLYYQGKLFGGIYDDRLLLKCTPSSERLLLQAQRVEPYPKAKEMLYVEPTKALVQVVHAMYAELPEPKKKK